MMVSDHKKRLQTYDRALFSESVMSLFWGVIRERKKSSKFTMQSVADGAGMDKGKVSRDFSGTPNLTFNTAVDYANALGVDLEVRARDRQTGTIYTSRGTAPAGYALASSTTTSGLQPAPSGQAESGGRELEETIFPEGRMQTRAAVG